MILTAQTGEKISADMLLVPAEELQAAQEAKAEAEAEELIERMKKARKV